MILYANCSESTMRINVKDLSEKERDQLQKELMKLVIETQNECETFNIEDKNLAELEAEFSGESYETYIFPEKIFGLPILTIKGDFPYNNSEILTSFAEDKELEFEFEEE